MKNLLFCILLASLGCYARTQANWNNSTFVHQAGKYIVDGNNDTIQLNGVNLGGWLMWEGWIWGGNFTQEKTIYSDIETIVGTSEADAFREAVYDNYITKADIQAISEQCFNVVRVPFNHFILEDDFNPYVYKQSGWDRLDSLLSWCEEFNVYAVLDLHSAPGGQSGLFTSDPDFIINLWNGSINQQRTVRLWKAIANRYQNRGIIAGYDLLNEPDVAEDTMLVYMYEQILDSVRSVDNNHMVFIEGNNFANDFSIFSSPLDNNMSYEFHFYTWFFNASQADSLAKFTELSDTSQIPIWCGEWGENDYTNLSASQALFKDPLYNVSGQAIWTWKKMEKPNAYPDHVGIDSTFNWNKTIKWIGFNSNPQPTYTEMTNGMAEFLNNSLMANCHMNQTFNQIIYECADAGTDQLKQNNYHVFPNPTNGILSFNSFENLNYSVFNLKGQLLLKGTAMNGSMDVSVLEAGIYVLEIEDFNSERFKTRFVKE
jgi:aryl-phospho-beta-D-glucosidase BglC (GH1 family)